MHIPDYLRGTSQLLSMESKQLGDYQAYSSEARVQQEDSMGIGHEEHGDADCHVKLLLQELHDHINSHSTSYPEDSARINVQSTILILLGVPDIGSILAVVKQFKSLWPYGAFIKSCQSETNGFYRHISLH